jgi:hypothetical protein
VTGRLKDVIIGKMENISAREVAELLVTHDGVAKVAVIALSTRKLRERLTLVDVPPRNAMGKVVKRELTGRFAPVPAALLGPKQHRVWKPVITAVHGMAAGGAMYFINESDIVICSDDATFFDPHANGGLVSALEPVGMLRRGVPLGDVLRWALLGNNERITAATALRLGLVSEVLPRAELWPHAAALAAEIAARRPEGDPGHDPRHLGVD